MFTTEVLHEIFLRRDLENRSRMNDIEIRIGNIQAQLELIIKLMREAD